MFYMSIETNSRFLLIEWDFLHRDRRNRTLEPLKCHPCACKLFRVSFPLNSELFAVDLASLFKAWVAGSNPAAHQISKPQSANAAPGGPVMNFADLGLYFKY